MRRNSYRKSRRKAREESGWEWQASTRTKRRFFFFGKDLERDKVKIMVNYSARKLERLRLTMWVISMFEERAPKSRIHTRSFFAQSSQTAGDEVEMR